MREGGRGRERGRERETERDRESATENETEYDRNRDRNGDRDRKTGNGAICRYSLLSAVTSHPFPLLVSFFLTQQKSGFSGGWCGGYWWGLEWAYVGGRG